MALGVFQRVNSSKKFPLGYNPNEDGPPVGYKPLSIQQRNDWNQFVRYLNRDLKVGGNKDLDDRNNSKGLQYLQDFKKMHPNFSITPEMIPYIQYEFKHLKEKNILPNSSTEGRVRQLISNHFQDRELSGTDGWIGSLTSRQAYPEIEEFSDDPQKKRWGVDYEGASKYEKEKWMKKAITDKKK